MSTTVGLKRDNVPPQIVTESLGSQIIEDAYVEVRGQHARSLRGEKGTIAPSTLCRRVGVSKELEVSILNKYIDPPSGESTTRLTNIDLSEPSIDLFQLPPDYKIVDDIDTFHHQP